MLKKLSADARKGAEQHLNINELAKELIEVYKQVSPNQS
jgi:hypothetical protein